MPRRITVTVRARLLAALAFLGLAVIAVGAISWSSLERARDRLDRLHGDTLAEVAGALALTRRASDLATGAPFLLTHASPFRIRQDGRAASDLVETIAESFVEEQGPLGADLAPVLAGLRTAIDDLVTAAEARSALQDLTLRHNAVLALEERRLAQQPTEPDRLALQRIAAALLGAGRAENLVGVGEYHREFRALARRLDADLPPDLAAVRDRLLKLAVGPDGLLELRRREIAREIEARAALVRIRRGADAVSASAAAVTTQAQATLAAERARITSSMAVASGTILGVGIVGASVALFAALFVSGYVTGNLRAISDAMTRLAAGDRSSRLPRGAGGGDEIGKLLHAFRAFRSNALRLDRSNRQLAQKNALLERMVAGMSDGLAIVGAGGALIGQNERLAATLHVDPALLQGRAELDAVLRSAGFAVASESAGFAELVRADGLTVERRSAVLPGGDRVLLFADVTERRRVEDRLREIQRIESLGKVTGEVAHDFGNILSTISSALHLLETAGPGRVPALRQTIASAVDHGGALAQRLLAFARRQHLEPETVELNALVEGMEDLVRLALRDGVDLRIVPADGPVHVRVDPGQLESAILNLCLNAGQAIEGDGEIVITLSALLEGATLEVTDDGRGMPPNVLRHALEPFFSARRDGAGTGLGLAMVYGFIRQSGGDIQIVSEEGRGTTVRLSLPAAEPETVAALPWRRVLLVEDDPADMVRARALFAAVPEIEVFAFADIDEAHAVLENGSAPFDLVVTDLHLAGDAHGWSLAEAALLANPHGQAIVVSGRLPAANPLAGRFGARTACVSKPLTLAALLATQPTSEKAA